MTEAPLSVVVASHGRPLPLRRCLLALAQCAYRPMEVIAVADKAGLEAVAGLPFAQEVRTILQAEPNLAAARNLGIGWARGEVVAFIDDDAVPEPTWPTEIMAAFAADVGLAAVTGDVLGRNGISLQWGPMGVDALGRDVPLADAASPLPEGIARKLHGTNMALRRTILMELGGFEPAFRFYLDDTDLSRDLHVTGHRTVHLRNARVHHAFAASERRTAGRVPLDLHDIGASTAVFLRKHAPGSLEKEIDRLAEGQRARLFRLARKRELGPRDIERLMRSLRDGIAEGRTRALSRSSIEPRGDGFSGLGPAPQGGDTVLAGWRHAARRLRQAAARLTAEGRRVTLVLLEPTPRAHKVAFTDAGWWEQTGGLFGRSVRTEPRLQWWRLEARARREADRVARVRFPGAPDIWFLTGPSSDSVDER